MARKAGRLRMERRTSYLECIADDVPTGKLTSFAKAVKLKRGETVVFAWIT